jgi:hypothetical protein
VVYTIADSFGCHVAYTSDTIVVLDSSSCLSFINDIATADGEQLHIVPNPVSSTLSIAISATAHQSSSLRLCIANLVGENMYCGQATNEPETIDVQQYPAGFYIVYLQSDFKMLAATKFIKL